jgi:hypothetical protein
MNGVADAVERFGYDRDAACGPADLLPGLAELQAENERLRKMLRPSQMPDAYDLMSYDYDRERALADELAECLIAESKRYGLAPAAYIALANHAEARR